MPHRLAPNPFDLNAADAYRDWREWKLSVLAKDLAELRVPVADPTHLTTDEHAAIRTRCRHNNWALVSVARPDRVDEDALKQLGAQLGLTGLDHNLGAEDTGLTALTTKDQQGHRYIPYTDKPMSWHTDGYYNDSAHQIRGMILYCAQDAAEGGENEILDHELLYIRLRDSDPGLIEALMSPDAMTIPANEEYGEQLRPDHTGPVFSLDTSGNLHMRYSARKRNIRWKDDDATRAAAAEIEALLSDPDTPISRYRMQPGEAIVANNVLHRREGFRDDPASGKKRLYYRARYYDRIAGTGITED